MNIYEKLQKITEEMAVIEKGLNVQVNKNASYKAVSERDILDNVKPLESKYKVYSYPIQRKIVENDTLVKETEFTDSRTDNVTVTKTNTLFMRIETTYRFINIEKPDEYVDMITYGDGLDTGDKAPGKAITYADKYALMKAYKISTGDDPDKEASPEKGYERNSKKQNKDLSPYEFEDNEMTSEQLITISNLEEPLKEQLRNFYKKDPTKLTRLEAEQSINSLKQKGLIKSKEQIELEKKTKEEVF